MEFTTFVQTLTNTDDIISSVAGPAAFQVLFDFSAMTSGDTVVVRFKPNLTVGGPAIGAVREFEHGVTTNPEFTDGVLGVDWNAWLSPVYPAGFAQVISIESTAGALFDVEVEVYQLGVSP